jgi:hypothetical protein
VYFPIFDDATKYKAGRPGKINGMRQDAIDAIDAVEPYKGGSKDPQDTLWYLHKLKLIDKHRLLLAVASQYQSHSLTPGQRAEFTKRYYGSYPSGSPAPDLRRVMIPPKVRIFPMKAGYDLLTVPQSEVEQNMKFRFVIAFGESGMIEGEPVFESLKRMADFVRAIVADFAPLLK